MTALARLSGRRPKRVVAIAIMLAVVAGVLGGGVASRLGPYGADDPATDSVRTSDALERATGLATTDSVVVLVRGKDRAAGRQAGADLRPGPAPRPGGPPGRSPHRGAAC